VPGPSAAIAALSVSGLPSDRFLFVGFLPARAGARERALLALADRAETLVIYESPHRLTESLAGMAAVLGDRDAFLCREATKVHEEYRRGRLSELREMLSARGDVKGEVVLVVAGAGDAPSTPDAAPPDLRALFAQLTASGMTRRQAVKEAARRLGRPAREVYAELLQSSE
jgi:16S rRNA (cytidine1402-2'-O)-methyltransferase